MLHHDPHMYALVTCYCKHRGYFYRNDFQFQKFKLFASWYLNGDIGRGYTVCPAADNLPWYHGSWELSELAKILKISAKELLGMIEEIYK